MVTRIKLPRQVTSTAREDVIRAHEEIVIAPGDIELDASATLRVGPFGATVLALAVARRRHQGSSFVTWVPPRDEACARFLED